MCLYILELFLLQRNLINIVYASKRNNRFRRMLFGFINQKGNPCVCTSYLFGRELNNLKVPIILDIDKFSIERNDVKELYLLMWSLVLANFVTEKTYRFLRDFIPQNYPIYP